MNDIRNMKNKIIFTLSIVILVMVTAIVVLAYNNDYKKELGDGASWNVSFTSIGEGEKIGKAVSRQEPYYTSTYASFYVDFVAPGDSMTYNLQVSNRGSLDAELQNIIYVTNPNDDAIKYEIIDIEEGYVLKSGTSKNFKIKISYVLDSNVGVTFDKPISVSFNFGQYIK